MQLIQEYLRVRRSGSRYESVNKCHPIRQQVTNLFSSGRQTCWMNAMEKVRQEEAVLGEDTN